jgi:hypothetical protein
MICCDHPSGRPPGVQRATHFCPACTGIAGRLMKLTRQCCRAGFPWHSGIAPGNGIYGESGMGGVSLADRGYSPGLMYAVNYLETRETWCPHWFLRISPKEFQESGIPDYHPLPLLSPFGSGQVNRGIEGSVINRIPAGPLRSATSHPVAGRQCRNPPLLCHRP